MIEIVKGREMKYTSGYGYSAIDGRDVDLVRASDLDLMRSKLSKMDKSASIDTKGAVYFHKEAVFPRAKLKDVCENPVVRKIENAEYVIIGKDKLQSNLGAYCREWHWDPTIDRWCYMATATSTAKEQFFCPDYLRCSDALQSMRFIEQLEGKKIILDEDLNRLIPKTLDMKEGLYTKLDKMLSSHDKQNIKIGIEIIGGLNYEKYPTEVVLLLNKNIKNIRGYQACYTVSFKSLIKIIEADYPSWDTEDNLSFMLEILRNDSTNNTVLKSISDHFNSLVPLDGKSYQLSIVEGELMKVI